MDVRDVRRKNILKLIGNNSQRAWAESVGMLPAHVNQVIKGRRNVGYKLARKIEATLGMDDLALDNTGFGKSSTVNPVVLASILEEVQFAVSHVGLDWSLEQIARLTASLYALYEKTGEMPIVEQAIQLESLRVCEKQ